MDLSSLPSKNVVFTKLKLWFFRISFQSFLDALKSALVSFIQINTFINLANQFFSA